MKREPLIEAFAVIVCLPGAVAVLVGIFPALFVIGCAGLWAVSR